MLGQQLSILDYIDGHIVRVPCSPRSFLSFFLRTDNDRAKRFYVLTTMLGVDDSRALNIAWDEDVEVLGGDHSHTVLYVDYPQRLHDQCGLLLLPDLDDYLRHTVGYHGDRPLPEDVWATLWRWADCDSHIEVNDKLVELLDEHGVDLMDLWLTGLIPRTPSATRAMTDVCGPLDWTPEDLPTFITTAPDQPYTVGV